MQDANPPTVYLNLIEKADAAFGRCRWSHEVVSQTTDFISHKNESVTVGCATVMKVKLDTGRYHQDFGYSESIARTEGLAIFKARASSCTNAFRRTLLAFAEIRLLGSEISGQSSSSTTTECSSNVNKFQTEYEAEKIDSKETQKRKRLERQKELQNRWKEQHNTQHNKDLKNNVDTDENNVVSH